MTTEITRTTEAHATCPKCGEHVLFRFVGTAARPRDGIASLIERLEKLTGPDREVDVAILTQVMGYRDITGNGSFFDRGNDGYWTLEGDERNAALPSPTSSLDAALQLVPEGHWWEIGKVQEPTSPVRHFGSARVYMASVGGYGEIHRNGHSDFPAIALCIAALKAQAAMEPHK